jgi:hypothetical protein
VDEVALKRFVTQAESVRQLEHKTKLPRKKEERKKNKEARGR